MDLLTKILFFITRANLFVEFDKEGAPSIIYKTGERYEIPALRPSHQRLEIDELGIRKLYGSGDVGAHIVLRDLKRYCAKYRIEVVEMGAVWRSQQLLTSEA